MTISVTIRVMDGMVFASDSTSTLMTADGNAAANTYDHADKILNLCKGRPLGVGFWGMGSIGSSSMATLMKDLRARFSGMDPDHKDWALQPDCSVQEVAIRVKEFVYDEHYQAVYRKADERPSLGIAVGGYTPGKALPERYEIIIDEQGDCSGPEPENEGLAGDLHWEANRRRLRGSCLVSG